MCRCSASADRSWLEVRRFVTWLRFPWVPHAIRANSALEWRELDQRTAEVAARVDDERIAVRLVFNDAGEVTQTIAQRPRLEAGDTMTSWIGTYQDYESLAGVRVPDARRRALGAARRSVHLLARHDHVPRAVPMNIAATP